jgi:hypothetical protein
MTFPPGNAGVTRALEMSLMWASSAVPTGFVQNNTNLPLRRFRQG